MSLVTGACWCSEAGATWEKGDLDVALVDQQALPEVFLQMKAQGNAEMNLFFSSILGGLMNLTFSEESSPGF